MSTKLFSLPSTVNHFQVEKFEKAELQDIDGKERIPNKEILNFVTGWYDVVNYADENRLYYVGMDPYILSGQRSDGSYKNPRVTSVTTAEGYGPVYGGLPTTTQGTQGVPDWRIPIPYAAKIIDTITGYMYKPGSVEFSGDEERYLELLQEVNEFNDGTIKNSEIGIDQSINGVAFELIHTDGTDKANPIYSRIPLQNGIPVYDWSLERKLIAFIYFFSKKDGSGKRMREVRIYYDWGFDVFKTNDVAFGQEGRDITTSELVPVKTVDYFFNEVPVAIYKNNKEDIGDFDRVKTLIDAYDYFMSDNINELERFAQAYLVLVGARLRPGEEWDAREKRIISVLEKGGASFLTKDINAEHMQIMARLLREEIHKQSHIVDFTDERFGGQLSGAAMDRLLLDMNNLSNVKQIYYEKGLKTRLRLIGKLILTPTSEIPNINIMMTRNVPIDKLAQAEFLLKTNGQISQKTRFENVNIVKDVEAEIEALNEELEIGREGIDENIREEIVREMQEE